MFMMRRDVAGDSVELAWHDTQRLRLCHHPIVLVSCSPRASAAKPADMSLGAVPALVVTWRRHSFPGTSRHRGGTCTCLSRLRVGTGGLHAR